MQVVNNLVVYRIVNPPKFSNCFVITRIGCSKCLVIDPGTLDCKELISFLDSHKLTPEYVFLTHEHIDHIAGCNLLDNLFGNIIIGTLHCQQYSIMPRFNLTLYQDDYPLLNTMPRFKQAFEGHLKFLWNGVEVECFEAKGHSCGSMLIRIGNHFFTGDTFIKGINTYTKLPGGSKVELVETFKMMLQSMNDYTIIHSGHLEDCSFEEAQNDIIKQIAYLQERINRNDEKK